MSNLQDQAKQDISQARAGLRGWIGGHPFMILGIAIAAGALALLIIFH